LADFLFNLFFLGFIVEVLLTLLVLLLEVP